MKRIFKLIVFILPLFSGLGSTAQRNKKDSATYCITRAINLEDQGKPADAIAWIRKAQKLEPRNIDHDYELAYAYFLNKNLDQAIAILEKLLPRPTVNGKIYQLLGNTYDESGNPDKAMETYRAGLQRFPGSGELYLESGIIYLKRKDYDSAVSTFEKGIEMDPGFSSNYYRAAKLYLSSNEKIWGMIYGELFMLLEPMSERSKELSRLLYETYKKQIALAGYGQAKAYFANRVIPDSIANQASLVKQTNFARKIYDGLLADAFKTESAVNYTTLCRARKAFIEAYYRNNAWKEYPNALFDYQYKMLKSGQFDNYNRWLLSESNTGEFNKWKELNRDEYLKFAKWLIRNPVGLDDKYKFYRGQYR